MQYTRNKQSLANKLAWFVLPVLLIACGGGEASSDNSTTNKDTKPDDPVVVIDSTWLTPVDTIRFINRASFGATPSDVDLYEETTASEWFQSQLSLPPTLLMSSIAKYTRPEDFEEPSLVYMASTSLAFWQHAIEADDQLRQRVAFALSEILVTSTNSGDELAEHAEAMAYYQDILIKNAFGNYRDILQQVTYSPAMGFYLTYMGNQKGNDETGRKPDENYARELLQLFTIGVTELNLDGTPKKDEQGAQIEAYNNDDIQGLARVFTGLNLDEEAIETSVAAAFSVPMWIFDEEHSDKEKSFLQTTIAEDTSAEASINMALDAIFAHHNVAPFISQQLIQRLVVSNPTPAYVQRVASVFESGQFVLPNGDQVGTKQRGDMAATVAAILFDSEALATTALAGGKIREPIIRFTQWARAFEAHNIWPEFVLPLWDTSSATRLGQHPYRAPSVFNFFRPGYKAPGSVSAENELVAPELQITNATSIPGYINFMTYFITGQQANVDVDWIAEAIESEGLDLDPEDAPDSFLVSYDYEVALAENANALVAHLNLLLTANALSEQTIARISTAVTKLESHENRVKLAVLMVMTSSDYLVQL